MDFRKIFKEWILPFGIEIIVLVLLLKLVFTFVAVPTESMVPTIEKKSLLFSTYVHNTDRLQRGQIIVFDDPNYDGRLLIKRLIGLPGETLQIQEDGTVLVDGEILSEPYVVNQMAGYAATFEIPAGHYLFLGDNRASSADARYWADPYVPAADIVARAQFTIWPLTHFGSFS